MCQIITIWHGHAMHIDICKVNITASEPPVSSYEYHYVLLQESWILISQVILNDISTVYYKIRLILRSPPPMRA